MFEDRLVICKDCRDQFAFTVGEQEYFSKMGLKNPPKRCQNCRLEARAKRSGNMPTISSIECAACSCLTKVPFSPKGHRPIYCRACMAHEQSGTGLPILQMEEALACS